MESEIVVDPTHGGGVVDPVLDLLPFALEAFNLVFLKGEACRDGGSWEIV